MIFAMDGGLALIGAAVLAARGTNTTDINTFHELCGSSDKTRTASMPDAYAKQTLLLDKVMHRTP